MKPVPPRPAAAPESVVLGHSPGVGLLDLGRLLRLSLAPSALADIAAGCVLAAGVWPAGRAPFVLMAASLCVYHGGMGLNDWADRAEDALQRRARPLPLGRIRPAVALALALVMLAAGPLLAATVSAASALVLGAVAATAVLYDLVGRGPWRGPFLLALCRAGNLSAGLLVGGRDVPHAALWLAPLVYAAYVLAVSRVARLEDLADPLQDLGARASRWLLAAALLLGASGACGFLLAGELGTMGWERALPLLPAALGALGLVRAVSARSGSAWTPADVGQCVGMGLRRLLVVTATLALAAGAPHGLAVAAVILLGYPASYALRRVFPPT